MPKLIAKERFFYAGRNVEVGEEFDAQQQDVALLTNSISPRATAPQSEGLFDRKDEQATDENKTGRGRYKRRDLRARE